ncbi:Trans-aconitate 2-methyltransferase [anaerobic digester metagenome]
MINNDEYWDERFSSGDWVENKGNEQTLFHYNILLNYMPRWLKKKISDNKMSICDLGCGMGEGTYLLKKYFKDSEVMGVDFSNYAIKEAKKKYVNASFICSDISKIERHYDVVVSSHTLEHFEDPNKVLNDIINLADKFFILIIPFQEENLYKEHFYSFDYDFFPINIQDHQLVHYKEIDRIFYEPQKYWAKKQIVIVYANKKNVDINKFSLEEFNNNYFTEFRLAKENYETKFFSLEQLNNSLEQLNKKLEDQNKVLESRLIREQKVCDAIKKQNVYLEGSVKAYQLRKVVKATDTVLRMGHSLKSTLKKVFNQNSLEFSDGYSEVHKTKPKKLKDIKVAVILDEFSYNCFKYEFNAISIEPSNWLEIFKSEKPDLFLCESAWSGIDSELRPWKGKIYSSTNYKHENRTILLSILEYCKKHNIPTIFWNKEDPTHYDDKVCNFVDTALKFDHIFTTAEECVERYKNEYDHQSVHCLMFGAQPKLFNPIEEQERSEDVIFAGSWYGNIHPQRSKEMKEIFDSILNSGYNLKIYDRSYYTHKGDPNRIFPEKYSQYINPPVPFDQIEKVYKESKYALNINTEIKSKTMFARRVFELMLCNTLVLSNYSQGMDDLFGDNIIFVNKEKINLFFSEKKRNTNLCNVLRNHTYLQRFKQILDTINYEYVPINNEITFYYTINDQSEIEDVLKHYESMDYKYKRITLLLSKNISNYLIKNICEKYANDEVSIYSLDYLLQNEISNTLNKVSCHETLKNMNELLSNNTPYFIFANLQLEPDFVEKGILHYSYIEKKFGISIGDKFTFKEVKDIDNVILSNENFMDVFNSIFKDIPKKFSVYTLEYKPET